MNYKGQLDERVYRNRGLSLIIDAIHVSFMLKAA